jgi:hypothetical protein
MEDLEAGRIRCENEGGLEDDLNLSLEELPDQTLPTAEGLLASR